MRRVMDPTNPYTGEGGQVLPFAGLLNESQQAQHEQTQKQATAPAPASAPPLAGLESGNRIQSTQPAVAVPDPRDALIQELMAKVQAMPSQPAPQPAPPLSPVQPANVSLALLQELQTLQRQVYELQQRPVEPRPVPMPVSPPLVPPQPPAAAADSPEPNDDEVYRALVSVGLGFLTGSRPRQGVTFDLHKGGRHKVYYHAVIRSGRIVSMIYDNRYDGNQFVPPRTPEQSEDGAADPPISALLPDGEEVSLLVPGLDLSIGPLDITNFIVVGES